MVRSANAANINQSLSDAASLYIIDQIVLFQELLAVVRLDKQFKRVSEDLWLVVVRKLVLLSELSVRHLCFSVALSALLLIVLHVLSPKVQVIFSQLFHTEF